MNMRGSMQYFTCKISKFPKEIIFTRQNMACSGHETWYLHEMWHFHVVMLTKPNNWGNSIQLSFLLQPADDYMQSKLIWALITYYLGSLYESLSALHVLLSQLCTEFNMFL